MSLTIKGKNKNYNIFLKSLVKQFIRVPKSCILVRSVLSAPETKVFSRMVYTTIFDEDPKLQVTLKKYESITQHAIRIRVCPCNKDKGNFIESHRDKNRDFLASWIFLCYAILSQRRTANAISCRIRAVVQSMRCFAIYVMSMQQLQNYCDFKFIVWKTRSRFEWITHLIAFEHERCFCDGFHSEMFDNCQDVIGCLVTRLIVFDGQEAFGLVSFYEEEMPKY